MSSETREEMSDEMGGGKIAEAGTLSSATPGGASSSGSSAGASIERSAATSAATNAAMSPGRARPAPRLALVELLDADGRVLQALDVLAWPLRIGRALDNELVLHDAHAAAHHATLDLDHDGALRLTAGASRNGLRIEQAGPGAARSAGSAAAPRSLKLVAGERALLLPLVRWHIGASTLRVRRLEDPLPDEEALTALPPASPPWVLPLLALACFAWLAGTLWLDNNPGASWEDYAPPLLAGFAALALWVSVWGLASKLFTRHFTLVPHLRVVLGYALVAMVVDAGLAVLAYMFDWPWASRIRGTVSIGLGAALLAQHVRLVAPGYPRRVNSAFAGMALLTVAVGMAFQWQRNDRAFGELYSATLLPPAWRLANTQAPQALIEELRALQAPLSASAKKAAAKEVEP